MASERTKAALEELRAAMIEDDGMDEGTVDAVLHAAQPNDVNLVGNFADLQRIGALVAEQGASGAEAVEQGVEVPPSPAPGEDGGSIAADNSGGDLEAMTKAELEEEAGRRGVEVSSSMTKAEMIAVLEGG